MEIDKREVEFTRGRKGTMNYFRSLSSKREFDESPEKYINFYGPRR
jgi:YHS domain-containing protein